MFWSMVRFGFAARISSRVGIRSLKSLSLSLISNSRSNLASFYSTSKMTKTAIVLLANGAEEMEFVIAADVLRRAGISVTVAGVSGADPVKCSRQVTIVPDESLSTASEKGPYDVVVLPGGLEGAKNLAASDDVGKLLKDQEKNDRVIAAICAAPIALKTHGIGVGKNVTSYPSFKDQMTDGEGYTYKEDRVVMDGNLITSRGPATAFDFALAIVEKLLGKSEVEKVAKPMLISC